jgi:glyoxylase-like metal-dependent hydrolase (beta-lactamase superfamily II)
MTATNAQIIPLELAQFRFADDEPHAGELGVVMAYAVRDTDGIVLFDTGFGFGNEYVEQRYRPQSRRVDEVLVEHGIDVAEITAVVNCHLHIDHAGQNTAFARIPIHVQRAEWDIAHSGEHTILEWIESGATDYRLHDGDYELLGGIRILHTPGHTVGHQSIVVEAHGGLTVLAGQAVYSRDEWIGVPGAREGRSRAPDQPAYDDSLNRLRDLNPIKVYFAHDRAVWSAQTSDEYA